MRKGKSPTRAQKELLSYYGLNPADWLVAKNTSNEMTVVHRHTNTARILPKEVTK